MLYVRALVLFIVACCQTSALSIGHAPTVRSRAVVRMEDTDDVIGSPFIKAINSLQEAIQTSPAAKFKAGLAKLQAGDYDQAATKAELDGLISENRVVMFSFTT